MTRNRRAISFAFCFFSLTAALKAQGSQPVPPKSAITADATTAESPTHQLEVNVRRVVVDVVVTDAKGNPVEGLKQDDFKVMENGVVQPLHFFDVHNGASSGASQQALDLRLPTDTFSNLSVAPADKPVTVLLYDMLDTPQTSFSSAHQALVKFIKDQGNSTKIAIFVLTDRLHMLQGFTDDETRLMQAVNSKRATSQAPPLRAAPFANDIVSEDPTLMESDAFLITEITKFEELMYQGIKRNRITVDAFIEIARFVSALPGRKNLIWMSGSFPTEIFSNGTRRGDAQWQVVLDPGVRAAKKQLDESRVAVYPVDVRGLQADPQYSAANLYSGRSQFGITDPRPVNFFGLGQGVEHATMDVIADSTGGRAFYNTNGLREAMDAAVRQGSDYYTLTYAPSNSKADGGERNIKIELKEPGYQLSYRRSYLADDARYPAPVQPLLLDMNMQHGAPNSSQLFFEAKVTPVGSPMAASKDEVKAMQTFLQKNAKGLRTKSASGTRKVQHYDIDFAIVGRQLEMPPTQSGEYATDMRFGLAAYTPESELLNGTEIRVKNAIPAAQYQKIESEGYHASMVFAVPDGAVSLRMAVRDEIGKRIGTLEIPLPVPVPVPETPPLP
jgi:VWFA-related protein